MMSSLLALRSDLFAFFLLVFFIKFVLPIVSI